MNNRSIILLNLFFLMILHTSVFSQNEDISIKLDTIRVYYNGTSQHKSHIDSGDTYFLNGNEVTVEIYNKYSYWNALSNCTPCVLETYNLNETPNSYMVAYQFCGIGDFKKFDSLGNIIEHGSYMNHDVNNWDKLIVKGLCSLKTGDWIYFSSTGDTLFKEIWENGEFIQQIPEQELSEAWGTDVVIDGKVLTKRDISLEQLGGITLIPKFKNRKKHTDCTYKVRIEAKSLYSFDPFQGDISLMSLQPLVRFIKDSEINIEDIDLLEIKVFEGDRIVERIHLQIK